MHSSLTSDADVDKRDMSAVAAFGALRGVLCNSAFEESSRGEVYSVLVLAVLLCGSEVWCPREGPLAKLRIFKNTCCRAMCRVIMKHRIIDPGVYPTAGPCSDSPPQRNLAVCRGL